MNFDTLLNIFEAAKAGPGPDNQPVCPFCETAGEYGHGEVICLGCGHNYFWMVYHGDGRFYPVIENCKQGLVGQLKSVSTTDRLIPSP